MIESYVEGTDRPAEKTAEKTDTFFDKFENAVEVTSPKNVRDSEMVKAFWDGLESDYLSTYEERMKLTPTDANTERGAWEGERGETKYIPSDEKIKGILAKHGLDGIVYKDGIPDFSVCSEATVEIDDMTDNRSKNYEQAAQKCAEQWNAASKDGRVDWTARDVTDWRRENGHSWHECNDRKTCQLVPTEINDYFRHLGGVSECKKASGQEDDFDE